MVFSGSLLAGTSHSVPKKAKVVCFHREISTQFASLPILFGLGDPVRIATRFFLSCVLCLICLLSFSFVYWSFSLADWCDFILFHEYARLLGVLPQQEDFVTLLWSLDDSISTSISLTIATIAWETFLVSFFFFNRFPSAEVPLVIQQDRSYWQHVIEHSLEELDSQ